MSEPADLLRVIELVCARLCHDTAGPIGTVHQALELARMDIPAGNEALGLARQAAGDVGARLKLFRAAWGMEAAACSVWAVRDLCAGLPGAGRVTFDWSGLPGGTVFAPAMARVVLNVLLLAHDSLPRSGSVQVAGGARDVFVVIDGPGAAWPAGLVACLADPSAALAAFSTPRDVQMPLTALLARCLGLRLSLLMPVAGGGPAPLRLSAP